MDDSEDEDFKPAKRPTRSKTRQNMSKNIIKSQSSKRKKTSETGKNAPMPSQVDNTDTKTSIDSALYLDKTMSSVEKNTKMDINSDVDKLEQSFEIKVDGKSVMQTLEFCPICQVPLSMLKISAEMHTASCDVPVDLQACPDGSKCLNASIFHYRDYSHHELAAFRDSEDYVEPDITFTPQRVKIKKTPMKNSSGKKRPSLSPVASKAKVPKKDDPCCSKDLNPDSPDMFCEADPVSSEKRKRLSFSREDIDNVDLENRDIMSPPANVPEVSISQHVSVTDGEQGSEIPDRIEQSELWCSDLILSEGTGTDGNVLESTGIVEDVGRAPSFTDIDVPFNIKIEAESQNSIDENVSTAASCANVSIQYCDVNPSEDSQSIRSSRMGCSQKCPASTAYEDIMQADCSVVFKANGVNRAEAMARNPMAVTLMVNGSGWEAVEIKGRKNTHVQEVEVSLCRCGHSIGIVCCVNERDVSGDVKFHPEDLEQKEIFFSTMADMGLKNQPFSTDFPSRKNLLKSSCNQITIVAGKEDALHTVNGDTVRNNVVLPRTESDESESQVDGNSLSKQPTKAVNAFELMKNTAKSGKPKRSGTTTSSLSSNSNSRPSTPTPVPMVVSSTTGSSWTLVPAKGKQDAPAGRAQTSFSRKVPAYKRIPGTQFVVDAFNYGVIPGVRAYFLSHFHSDHYMGLNKHFNMPIYCSQVTANLVMLKLRVAKEYLHVLKVGEPRVVCGVEVEVFDAYHCPGAIMFIFRLLDNQVFLHVGDFRAHPSMEQYPQLRQVDKLYLDTTYCDPAYDFPSQEEVVLKVIETVKEHLAKHKSTLIVSGTYTIGKEKVFMGIAEEFNLKIWTSGDKRKILQSLEDKKLLDRLTTDPFEAQVHVLAMRDIALEELLKHLSKYSNKFTHVLGFKPTGWTTSTSLKGKPSDFQKSIRGKATIYGVPYSEHSSYSELRRFVRHIKPKDIQVTVNVGKSAQYRKMFQQWLSNARDGDGQSRMVQYFASREQPSC